MENYNLLALMTSMTIILILLSIGILLLSMFEFNQKLLIFYGIKIKHKINILITVPLIIALIILIYLWSRMSSPLDNITSASFIYYSCLKNHSDKNICKNEHAILLERKTTAEMLDIKKDNIDEAIKRGKYKADYCVCETNKTNSEGKQ